MNSIVPERENSCVSCYRLGTNQIITNVEANLAHHTSFLAIVLYLVISSSGKRATFKLLLSAKHTSVRNFCFYSLPNVDQILRTQGPVRLQGGDFSNIW